jgi:hypothetical protein
VIRPSAGSDVEGLVAGLGYDQDSSGTGGEGGEFGNTTFTGNVIEGGGSGIVSCQANLSSNNFTLAAGPGQRVQKGRGPRHSSWVRSSRTRAFTPPITVLV